MSRYAPTVLPTQVDPYGPADRLAQAFAYAQAEGERKQDRRRVLAREEVVDRDAGIRRGRAPAVLQGSDDVARALHAVSGATVGGAGLGGAATAMTNRDRYVQLTPDSYLDTSATPGARQARQQEQEGVAAVDLLRALDPEGTRNVRWQPGLDFNPMVAAAYGSVQATRLEGVRHGNELEQARVGSNLRTRERKVDHRLDVEKAKLDSQLTLQQLQARHGYDMGLARFRAAQEWRLHNTPSGSTVYSQREITKRANADGNGGTRSQPYTRAQATDDAIDILAPAGVWQPGITNPEQAVVDLAARLEAAANGQPMRPASGSESPLPAGTSTLAPMRAAPPQSRTMGGRGVSPAEWDRMAAEARSRGWDPVQAIGFPRPQR